MKRIFRKLIRYFTRIDLSKVSDVELDGIDMRDYPDFCDAYIFAATYKGRQMTEKELDRLNEEHPNFVYDRVIAHVF